ncbi:uncharacterized protein TNCV_3348581 [Trichonephila clavipes]|nr:uncharacterized protein TNCV_3348581 [Trichonephila clavipes]
MITNFFIPELNNHDVQELWFQQDGATCHTARATIDLLKDTLGDRLISRFGPVNWPPRSCDLTPPLGFGVSKGIARKSGKVQLIRAQLNPPVPGVPNGKAANGCNNFTRDTSEYF